MKPSERILEISKELNKKDPMYVMMGGDMFIRSQAILDYLDEQHEKREESYKLMIEREKEKLAQFP